MRRCDGKHVVVAWDAPGAGRSTDPPEQFGLDAVEQLLAQALVLADASPESFAATLLPTMFSAAVPAETMRAFDASMRAFHPDGFRAMARASAEDVRDVLPHIDVPTLLVYGDRDVRAPRSVGRPLLLCAASDCDFTIP